MPGMHEGASPQVPPSGTGQQPTCTLEVVHVHGANGILMSANLPTCVLEFLVIVKFVHAGT